MNLLSEVIQALGAARAMAPSGRQTAADVQQIKRMIETMSTTVSDFVTHMTTTLDAISSDVTTIKSNSDALTAQVADLKAQLATAGLTPDQQASLMALEQKADAIKGSADALAGTVAAAPTPPAPVDSPAAPSA